MKKGQSPTEYIIILAVVTIISLIVVFAMGGLSNIRNYEYYSIASDFCNNKSMEYFNHSNITISCKNTSIINYPYQKWG